MIPDTAELLARARTARDAVRDLSEPLDQLAAGYSARSGSPDVMQAAATAGAATVDLSRSVIHLDRLAAMDRHPAGRHGVQ